MNRQLDAMAAGILNTELAQRGVDVRTATSPVELIKDSNQVTQITLEHDGQRQTLDTDLIVFATGILPNKEIGEQAGLLCSRGIQVNAQMVTSDPAIFSLGECCEFEGNTYGLVAPIWDQAKVLANELKNRYSDESLPADLQQVASYEEKTHLTKLKVSGLDMHSIGRFDIDEFDAEEGIEILRLSDIDDGIYKKLVLKNNRIIGVVCVGDVADSFWYHQLMTEQTDITPIRTTLLLGKAWSKAG